MSSNAKDLSNIGRRFSHPRIVSGLTVEVVSQQGKNYYQGTFGHNNEGIHTFNCT